MPPPTFETLQGRTNTSQMFLIEKSIISTHAGYAIQTSNRRHRPSTIMQREFFLLQLQSPSYRMMFYPEIGVGARVAKGDGL